VKLNERLSIACNQQGLVLLGNLKNIRFGTEAKIKRKVEAND
jgi:hypothetical protein